MLGFYAQVQMRETLRQRLISRRVAEKSHLESRNFCVRSEFKLIEAGDPEFLERRKRRRLIMKYLRYLATLSLLMLPLAYSHAEVRVGVGIGFGPGYVAGPPVCAYGYYGYYPYACAPYGYYGPNYFVNGVFIGAGPWYHGYYRPYYGRGWYDRDDWRWRDRDGWRDRDDWRRGERFEHHEFAEHRYEGRRFEGRGFDHDRGFHRRR